MDIQLASDIKDLLMDDGAVILPGFGGFTSTYKPAVTDGVMGVLHPPSYHLTFDPNQQTNDGKLVDYIREKYHITSAAAQEAIDGFVKNIHSNFDKNEIVILPEIGRLYRDFAQKIQFLPESTNFNADTFGLSSLNFSPISRTKPEPVRAQPAPPPFSDIPAPAAETPAKKEQFLEDVVQYKEKPQVAFLSPVDDVPPPSIIQRPKGKEFLPKNWLDYAPALAVLLIALLAILIWKNTQDGSDTEGGRRIEGDKPKVNVSPHANSGAVATTDVPPNTAVAPNVGVPQPPVESPQPLLDTTSATNQQFFDNKKKQGTAATPPPSVSNPEATHKATVIIGGFGNKANIARLKKWISEQGYGIHEKKKGGITEIGCEVGYESNDDFNRILKKIKARYGNDIQVFKK
jgi:CCDC81-like prokaryotic HU domain 2/CCDC81-like prokaryotic HU domain 1